MVNYWVNSISAPDDTLSVQSFVERTLVLLHTTGALCSWCLLYIMTLAAATPTAPPSEASNWFSKYAQMLVSVGQLEQAMQYMVPSGEPAEMELLFRIYQALPKVSHLDIDPREPIVLIECISGVPAKLPSTSVPV